MHGIQENTSYIKSSASGSGDGDVKQAANVWSDVQNSSDAQRCLDASLGTREMAHVDSSASAVQCNSSHEMNTKENTISSHEHYSSTATSLSLKHTENSLACEKSTTVPIDNDSNGSSSHEMVSKLQGHGPLKGNVDCFVQSSVSLPTNANPLAQKTFEVGNDSKIDSIIHDQSNSKAETIRVVVDHSDFGVEKDVVVDDQSNSEAETISTELDRKHLKDDIMIGQSQSDSKAETIIIKQGSQTLKDSVILDGQCPSDSTSKMVHEQNVPCTDSIMTVHDVTSDAIMVVADPFDSKTEVITCKPKDAKAESVATGEHQASDSETEKIVLLEHDSEPESDSSIREQNQNEAESKTSERTKCSSQALDTDVQSVITEQAHNWTKLETTVPVLDHTDPEIRTIVNMNQNDSKPKELAEGEHGHVEGEPQAMEMEVDDVDTQRDCNLECEKSSAGSECVSDTPVENVEKIDHPHMGEMWPEAATGKVWDSKSSHEGNVEEDLSVMQQNEQISQPRRIVVNMEVESSAEIAEKLPHDLAEQQKTSEVEFVLTSQSSQAAHEPCGTTEGHELRDTEMKCPTPTIDELPYIIGKVSAPSQGSTPTQDELPSDFESAGGEQRCHEPCSDPYDKADYNTEGLDLTTLSHMIAWFRKEQSSKRELQSVPSQNSGPVPPELSINSESRAKDHLTYPDSSSQSISSKHLSGSSSGRIESNMQNTESYKEQGKDGPVTDQLEDSMPVFQSQYNADEHFNAMDPDSRDSKSAENLSLCALSKSASYASIHDNAGKERKEKRLHIYEEEEIFDTESVSPTRMKDKQQERAYLKDVYSNKHKHYYKYTDNLNETWHCEKEEHHDALQYGVDGRFLSSDHMEEAGESSSTSSSESELESSSSCNESFMNYRKGEGLRVTVDFKRDSTLSSHESSIIAALDDGGMKMTCKNQPRVASHSRTIQNPCHKGTQRYVEKFLHKWDELHQANDDITQSSLDLEYLVFSEKMNHILKHNSKTQQTQNDACRSPVTIQFSSLNEQDKSEEICDALKMFSASTIKVTLADRKEKREEKSRHMPLRLQRLSCKRDSEAARSNISAITAEFAKSYYAMMDDVCTNNAAVRKTDRIKKQLDAPKLKVNKPVELKMKQDLFERLHDGLNSVVRQACKTKYRFFILVTSDDPFFKETKVIIAFTNSGYDILYI